MKNLLTFTVTAVILQSTLTFFGLSAHANELILTDAEARAQGYKELPSAPMQDRPSYSFMPYAKNLKWPFEKPYTKALLGNGFNQFQPYNSPGYHLGCDMIQERGSIVYAPIAGRLEAGHYGYTLKNNGDRIKLWKPWPEDGDEKYFEVAVIDDFGNRFEFHHIDRASLPAEIIENLNSATDHRISPGQALGEVTDWPTPFQYHHIHVNVYDSQGQSVNPESVFEPIPDVTPPNVKFLIQYADGQTEWLRADLIIKKPVESFIVVGYDEKDDSEYVQAPPFIELLQNQKTISRLDFTTSLLNEKNEFTDINDVYPELILLPNGQKLSQMNSFYPFKNVTFNIKISALDLMPHQPFVLNVKDATGNTTSVVGALE